MMVCGGVASPSLALKLKISRPWKSFSLALSNDTSQGSGGYNRNRFDWPREKEVIIVLRKVLVVGEDGDQCYYSNKVQ